MQFNRDIALALICNNVPLNILNDDIFRNVLQKYISKPLLSRSTYISTVVPSLYEERLSSAKLSLKKMPFYLILDETPDFLGRKIINVLVGKLQEGVYEKPILMNTLEIETANSESLAQYVLYEVSRICEPDEYKNFRLLLTDAAPYCVKTGKILKEVISTLKHVTCLAHALHNLAETIRSLCPGINECIALLTKVFGRSKSARKAIETNLKVKFASFPVLTRWGTWIKFAEFFFLNFQGIERYIVESTDVKFNLVKAALNVETINDEMNFIRDYFLIPVDIKKLEKQGLSIYDTIRKNKTKKTLIYLSVLRPRGVESESGKHWKQPSPVSNPPPINLWPFGLP